MKKKSKKTAALSHEYENFLADIENMMKAIGELTGEELQAEKQKILARVNEARELFVELSEDIVKRARKTSSSLNKEVHEEPWKAVGTGAAVGLLFGLLFARR